MFMAETKIAATGRPFIVETRRAPKGPVRRTGRPAEVRTKYRRRLHDTMRAVLPREFILDHLDTVSKSDPWTTAQMRPEVMAMVRLLATHHTAHAGKSEVSASEVLHALINAGLPVLLRQDGWRVPGAKV